MRKAFTTIVLSLSLLLALFGCGGPGTDEAAGDRPGWEVESSLLPVNATGRFLSDIVYTWTSSSSWTPPGFSQSFPYNITVETYQADGTYEQQRKVLEAGVEDWDQDLQQGEGWVAVGGTRGTYVYNTTTFVMTLTFAESYAKLSPTDTTPIIWRPIDSVSIGSAQLTVYCTEKSTHWLYRRIGPSEFKMSYSEQYNDGGTRVRDLYYSVDFAGTTPVVMYRDERVRRYASSAVSTTPSETYRYTRDYSGVVGVSPSIPQPTSLGNDDNYCFMYTVRTDTYYDWDSGTDTGFLSTPRTGYPQTTNTASSFAFVVKDGNLIDWGVYASRAAVTMAPIDREDHT